ncbi:MAG TPA: hypothetical protein VKX40_04805 [Aequorivita sp.]|nr:hypothetical protein [Aequorivita sp.]
MVEVFITNIQNEVQAEAVVKNIQKENPLVEIDFDIDETGFPFPCGHTILRVESPKINSNKLMESVLGQGFNCAILEDKICTKKNRNDGILGGSF